MITEVTATDATEVINLHKIWNNIFWKEILEITKDSFAKNGDFFNFRGTIAKLDWAEENKNISADIILAAECCYDSLTCKTFFKCIKQLFERRADVCYICFEERPNFMTEEMAGLAIRTIKVILLA